MTAKTKTTLGTETLRSRCSIAGTVCAVFTVPLGFHSARPLLEK